jgi:hypothetical protein
VASESGPGPTLINNIPSVKDRKASWVGIWQVTAYVLKNGKIVYRYNDGDPKLESHLGDGPAVVTDGYGGWQQTERPRRKPLTQWAGGKVFTMSVPVVISGWFHDSSVESRIRRLEQMARVDGGDTEPPPVAVTLPGDSPRDAESFVWVIDNIEWGASRRRDSDGHRTYQEATLSMIEFVRPDVVKLSASKARKKKKSKKKRKTHTGSTVHHTVAR